MKILINLLVISLIIVFIIDTTDFVDTIKQKVWKFAFSDKKPYKEFSCKPFDCSLCMTWWTGLIYLLIIHKFTILYVGYIALLALLTPVFNSILILIKDVFAYLLNKIYKVIDNQ